MTGAIIILCVTVAVGLLLYVYDLKYRRSHPESAAGEEEKPEKQDDSHGEICCGRHLICEKPLSPRPGEKIVYYDDEELDRFAGKEEDDYSDEEIEEIREVMMTLLPQDVAGWVRSIQLRGLRLPSQLRDELFILLECDPGDPLETNYTE